MSEAKELAKTKLTKADETNGWQSHAAGWEDFETYRNAEAARATSVRNALQATSTKMKGGTTAAANEREWRGLMWLWARRARRDILVLEETLRKLAKQTDHAIDDAAFYGDPGDPPPPPPEDW